ncbi:MAG: hypothetical protein WCV90_02840 [Candidatus Woesearchaeota archaeon]
MNTKLIDALVTEISNSSRQIDFSELSPSDRTTLTEKLGDLHWERYQQEGRRDMVDRSLEHYLLSGIEEKATKAAKRVIEGSGYFRARMNAVEFLQSKGELKYVKEQITARLTKLLTETKDSLIEPEFDLYLEVLGKEKVQDLISGLINTSQNMKNIYDAAQRSEYTAFWVPFEERCFQLEDFVTLAEAAHNNNGRTNRDLTGARTKAVEEAKIEQVRALAWLQEGGEFQYKYPLRLQEYITMALRLRERYVQKQKGKFTNAGFHWTSSSIYKAKELLEEANTPEAWRILSDWAQELLPYTGREDTLVVEMAFSSALNSGDENLAVEVYQKYYSHWGIEQALKQSIGHPLVYQACQREERKWCEQLVAGGSRDSLNVAERIYTLFEDASGLEQVKKGREREMAKHIASRLNLEATPENLDSIYAMGVTVINKILN